MHRRFVLLAALLLGSLHAPAAVARSNFPGELDRRCALENRTPPNPAALAAANAPLGDCALCHQFDLGRGQTPGAGNVKAAGRSYASGDLNPFCTLAPANRAPVLAAIGNHQIDVGELLSLLIQASDADGDGLSFSASPLPSGASFVDSGLGSATFEWTPAAGQEGNHTVLFAVSDGKVSDSESVVISVGPVNLPPQLEPIGDQTVDVGAALQLLFTATDPEGSALVYAIDGIPADALFTDFHDGTAELDWTPSAPGSHSVTVTVTDSGAPPASASESFALVARDPNAAGPILVEAGWSSRPGRLRLRGEGAGPGEAVVILDASSGAELGARRADSRGRFRLWLRPFLAPCAVAARSAGGTSEPLAVADAPADCGSALLTRVRRLSWRCSSGELRVDGDRAPAAGTVQVLDPDSGGLVLGEASGDRRGRFHLRTSLPAAPTRVQLSVLAGSGAWTLEPVAVPSRGRCGASSGEVDGGEDASSGIGSGSGAPDPAIPPHEDGSGDSPGDHGSGGDSGGQPPHGDD
jgi:Bacterial Ig domain